MSWICDEFSVWVCFGLSRGREKESRTKREKGVKEERENIFK